MELLTQPDNGIGPVISAIKDAQSSIQIVIFRADLKEFQRALESAVERGVAVHALVAHTNRGGEKRLRKLEQALLECGVTVTRTGDDLVRYHGKMLVIDKQTLLVLGFNYTFLDALKSRSFGIISKDKALVQDALALFEADRLRQPYLPSQDTFIVSPENSRMRLAALVKSAREQLLIYDPKIADRPMIRLLQERAKAGVEIRILGKVTTKAEEVQVEKMPKLRLHVRAILRDNQDLFIGSQSLRPLELDRRREIGLVVHDPKVIKQFRTVFEADWGLTDSGKKGSRDEKDDKKDEAKHETSLVSK
jgi:phosphatidylserine/phosphatidylglycerophosphate/cardiolipin synthase-like enzyme